MQAQWILPLPVEARLCRELADALGVPTRLAALLCRRGFTAPEAAGAFLEPRLKQLADPFLLPQMEAAVERLLVAVDRHERITLYGDYDVDGVTSVAILTRTLRAYGVEVQRFLPARMEEGYGLSAAGVERCLETCRPQLLVAVDCGTSSAKEIAELARRGVDTIVLDHHLPPGGLPECVAVVNPKLQPGCAAEILCTAGLAFKVAHALMKRRHLPQLDLREFLDLVAVGTVADLVPLAGENRLFVRAGLRQLEKSRWPGLQALCQVAGLSGPFTASDIGFKLGPRLNAAGRLASAHEALSLLLADDLAKARPLAESLNQHNEERRSVEDAVLKSPEACVLREFDAAQDAAIVVGAPGWHSGVIGIVASRLLQRYHRPVLVAGFDEAGQGKGSGRSITGYSLVKALEACTHLLEKHGGHDMAAGFSLPEVGFGTFRTAFLQHARGALTAEQLRPRLRLDGELEFGDIGLPALKEHEQLAPYGMGNPQPLFFARRVEPFGEPRVLKEKHLSFRLRQGRREVRAIWFGATAEKLPPPPWDVAFRLEPNEWEGVIRPQMEIRAVRAAQ